MIEPTKDTLEREGFWTYEQAIDQDLSDALDEFRAETNRRTDVLLRGILEREGFDPEILGFLDRPGGADNPKQFRELYPYLAEEISRRLCVVVRFGPKIAASFNDDLHRIHADWRDPDAMKDCTIYDYMLDGKSVLFVVHGFRGNVLTVRFVVVEEKE